MSDWKPIETAPKDGTRLLLWVPKAGSTTGGFDPSWSGNCWVYDNSRIKRDMEPSHWMPIPEPPTVTQAIRAEPSGDMVRCTIRTGTVDMRDLKIKARDAGLLEGLPLPPDYFDR
jgi:hypothetical protein